MKTPAALTLAAVLAGCATVDQDPVLSASVANLRLGQATLMETTATFTVRLQNERPEPLSLQGGVFKLYLDGSYLGQGTFNTPVELAGLSDTTVNVDTHLSNLTMARKITAIVEARRLDYRLTGRVYARHGTKGRTFNVAREGALDMNEFVPATPAAR